TYLPRPDDGPYDWAASQRRAGNSNARVRPVSRSRRSGGHPRVSPTLCRLEQSGPSPVRLAQRQIGCEIETAAPERSDQRRALWRKVRSSLLNSSGVSTELT